MLLRETECSDDVLYETAHRLLRERERRDSMVRALTSMATPDAGEKIYQTLLEIMK